MDKVKYKPKNKVRKLTAAQKRELVRQGWSKEDINHLSIQLDPVIWAETFLKDPENPRKALSVRWYQADMLRSESKQKVYRCGRRVGKSIVLCIEMLWKAFVNDDKRILVCAPYKNQVQQLWKDGFNKLIKGNPFIEAAISRQSSNPYTIEFKNGSRIMGLTAGSKTGNKGSSIRGQSADDLYLDEADYMGDEAIHSILAIQATTQNTNFVISSTPTGRREFYYEACTNKKLGYDEYHFGSDVSPEWISIADCKAQGKDLSKSQEYLFRNQSPEHVFNHEYLAIFGEEAAGVFKHEHIDKCLLRYNTEVEQVDPMGRHWWCGEEQNKQNVFILGIDWNGEENGTQFVITEFMREPTEIEYELLADDTKSLHDYNVHKATYQGKYRVFYRESVAIKDMTQLQSIKRVIELNKRFKIDHMYVDAGFGTTNIEELKLYGRTHRESGISEKLVPVEFGGSIYVTDPYTKEQVKKAVKPFMVYNAQNCIERHEVLLPEAEDEKVKLVGQVREYRIDKMSPQGVPQFSRENDHILDAFMLSLYGFQMEYSELVKVTYASSVAMTNKPALLMGSSMNVSDRQVSVEKDELETRGIPKRAPALNADNYHSDSRGNHMDYDDIAKKSNNGKQRSPFVKVSFGTGWSNNGNPSRSMF